MQLATVGHSQGYFLCLLFCKKRLLYGNPWEPCAACSHICVVFPDAHFLNLNNEGGAPKCKIHMTHT